MYKSQLTPIDYDLIEHLYPGACVQIDLPALYSAYVRAGVAEYPSYPLGKASVMLDSGFELDNVHNNFGNYYTDEVYHLWNEYHESMILSVDGAFTESYGCAPCRLEEVVDDGEYQQVFLMSLHRGYDLLLGSSTPAVFALTFDDLVACGYCKTGVNGVIEEAVPY